MSWNYCHVEHLGVILSENSVCYKVVFNNFSHIIILIISLKLVSFQGWFLFESVGLCVHLWTLLIVQESTNWYRLEGRPRPGSEEQWFHRGMSQNIVFSRKALEWQKQGVSTNPVRKGPGIQGKGAELYAVATCCCKRFFSRIMFTFFLFFFF